MFTIDFSFEDKSSFLDTNFSEDPEITIQNAIDRLKTEKWIKEGDSLVTVTNAFAHNRVVESIQLREIE